MVDSTRDKQQLGHVVTMIPPHRQLRQAELQDNPNKMERCDGMYRKVDGAHHAWQIFRRNMGYDSWIVRGLTAVAFLMTGGASAFSSSEEAMYEAQLKQVYDQHRLAYDRECLGINSQATQPVPSVQPLELSSVDLPVTIGGEVMLPEPSVRWVLAGYGVLGASVAATAAAIAIVPETAMGITAASLFPECAPVLSGLRFVIP